MNGAITELISAMRDEVRDHGLCSQYRGDLIDDIRTLNSFDRGNRYIWAPNAHGTHLVRWDEGQPGLRRLIDIIAQGFEGSRWYVIEIDEPPVRAWLRPVSLANLKEMVR